MARPILTENEWHSIASDMKLTEVVQREVAELEKQPGTQKVELPKSK